MSEAEEKMDGASGSVPERRSSRESAHPLGAPHFVAETCALIYLIRKSRIKHLQEVHEMDSEVGAGFLQIQKKI